MTRHGKQSLVPSRPTPMKTPSVLVSVITREHIFAGTAKWLLTCGYEVDIVHTYAPIVQNRNVQVKQFLDNTQFDYIFFLDSDTIPVAGTIETLLKVSESDRYVHEELTICVAPGWANMPGYPPYPAAYLEVPDKPRVYKPAADGPRRPMEVDACGMSGALVHRQVFHQMAPASGPWFHAETDIEGNWHSEDFNWFRCVQNMGYEISAHLDLIADHHKPVSLAQLRPEASPTGVVPQPLP